ncbi:MAG: PH domain-containing protein [Burkholderiales bacterium]|nr:PH domain-containing protein [Burkholderiales bacterium]
MNHHEEEMEQLERGGLPEPLPQGERVLWEGAPDWRDLALHVFHARKVAIYFALLLTWRVGVHLADGESVGAALTGSIALVLLGALAVGLLCSIAWFTARTARYAVTSERVIMRIGIVLTVTFNLPFKAIAAADLRLRRDGSGDIPLTLAGSDRIAYLNLWPHARPWQVKRPQPMLRGLPDAERVAAILARALAASAGVVPRSVASEEGARIVRVRPGRVAAA